MSKNDNGIAQININWDKPTYGKPLTNPYK